MIPLKYYAQKDAYGFPIPGTMMGIASHLPIPVDTLEIPAADSIPTPVRKGQGSDLRYFVRRDVKGNIIPNSLIATIDKPAGLVYEIQVPGDGINNIPTVAYVTDSIPHDFPLSYPSIRLRCNGVTAVSKYTSINTVATMTDLVNLFNSDPNMSLLGMYSAIDETTLRLTMGANEVAQYCPSGNITMVLFED